MKRRLIVIIAGIIVIAGIGVAALLMNRDEVYTNPVFEPTLADPSVIEADDGYFYAYGTEDYLDEEKGQPHIPIIRSKDLIEWEYVGQALEEKPDWKSDGFLWAPEIVKFGDMYHLYYSYSIWGDPNPGIGLAVSENPEGPFEDRGAIFQSEEIGVENSIDPFIVKGEPNYLFWGSFHGIYGIELEDDGFTTKDEKFQIAGEAFEATYIFEKENEFYFIGSTGSCCDGIASQYQLEMAKADDIKGPYLNQDGEDIMNARGTVLLSRNEEGEDKTFVGPGHSTMIVDDSEEYWLLYHAIDTATPYLPMGATRRPLMMSPMTFEDGWPQVETGQPQVEIDHSPDVN
ncbi:family 43 glycosylhydrolase [Salinicoccus sp. ID82-1]|uniref:family 43 glycosylhydrolase n=1 Tax=Salinicoccus sp. ID82-1 TaxID=2820269 RepID=UPI001F010503|nr:family 43 glycosylhydrolase [Salinicoccus sp. ID82-1]MCG1008466.1 family 43 glycosylhydrolase [Salinicoccus sp. ID82-1]